MAFITKDQILAVKDQHSMVVDIPEWTLPGEEMAQVRVSRMSGRARDQWEASCIGKNGGPNLINITAMLCAAVIIDENGELMFDEKDIIALNKKSVTALDRIVVASREVNNLKQSDLEELAKN